MANLFPNFRQFLDSAARMSAEERELVGTLLDSLGPVGSAMHSLARGRRPTERIRRRDIREAEANLAQFAEILRSFGYAVDAPEPGELEKNLEEAGFRRVSREAEPPPRPNWLGGQTRQIGGRTRQYKPDDPILTGEMIDVDSSNVHSIGFLWNETAPTHGTLQVRFLQSDKSGRGRRGSVPGPLYYYHGVHPDVFEAMRRASSKGKFVWDRIRIRGTVSGHRYAYDLKGIAQGYVPRKATRFAGNEYFIRREVKTNRGRTLESELDDRFVGRVNRGAPEIGVPSRGTPSRGTPGRGR